jgi:hypothetical protein
VESHGSEAACEAEYASRFDAAVEAGMRVRHDAFDRAIARLDDKGCEPVDLDDGPSTDFALRGDKGQGETCSWVHRLPGVAVEECKDGLSCSADGRCDPPLQTYAEKVEGDACFAGCFGMGELFCSPEGVCERRQALGASCFDGGCEICFAEPCDRSTWLYCAGGSDDATGVCAVVPDLGEPCDAKDYLGCGPLTLEASWAWCDPMTNTCADDVPSAVCYAAAVDAVDRD